MTVHIYRSTDAGATALSGTAGVLITLLDAVLVNGFNSKTVTITRSGTTATATSTAHGFINGQRLIVSGANETPYNISAVISNVAANTFDYTVASSPATPATGTITAKIEGAGWTKPLTGTNLAAYKQAAGSNGFYLRIDDTGTTNGRSVGYETMSDVNTGTNPFPSAAQFSGGLYFPKSTTADGTSRPWIMAATDKYFSMHISPATTTNATDACVCVFGDFKSFKSGDAYGTIHIAGNSSGQQATNTLYTMSGNLGTVVSAHYVPRSYSQLGTSLQVGKHSDYVKGGGVFGNGGLTYPNGPDGGLYMSPVWIQEIAGSGHIRGTLPGIWVPCHTRPLEHLDTLSGTGALAGKTFQALKMYTSAEMMLETSDTWDT